MLILLSTLVLAPALAGDPCNTPSCEIAHDAVAVLNIQPVEASAEASAEPPQKEGLPSGALSLDDLESTFEALSQDGATLSDFFALLADGESRSLSGDVVRATLEKFGGTPSFLPVDDLVSITSDGTQVVVNLDFGRSSSKKLTLPKNTTTVVASTSRDDPYATGSTRLETVRVGGHTLVLQEKLTLGISEEGLTSIGGVAVKKFLSFGVDGHSEHSPGKVAEEGGDVIVQTDADGKPVVKDGHYVPQTYDDWIILKVAGRTMPIGVPPLKPGS